MESWVLEGDSYSFLRSAPRNLNLQHADGPNRVEIFDITNIPSHRSAISETTCLCDIFGDDCESPCLSGSPGSTSFLKKDVDEQLPVEDVNDSSGSYHTANGSEQLSDGSDTFEDSKDTKDAHLSEIRDSNTSASDLTLPNDKNEVTAANGSPRPTGNWQGSSLSQDTSLVQAENSSDQQLVTSTSEFRDTNIRVTGSTQDIICPDLLSEHKGTNHHATLSEIRETDSTEAITTPDFWCVMKQKDASLTEQKADYSTQKKIASDSLNENRAVTEQRDTTISEVRETDSAQENKHYKQRESTFSLSNLESEDSPKEYNDLGCSDEEEEHISLPDILPPENSLLVHETVQRNTLTNFSNGNSDFSPLQKTASGPSAKEGTHDMREISDSPEHEDVPNKLADIGTFLCGDKADLKDSNTVHPPTYEEDNTEVDAASLTQHVALSSETETINLPESRALSSFSDATEGLISELYSPSGSSVDVNSSESPVIIYSPVGFNICPSPETKNKVWSSGPEDLIFIPESPESDYSLIPGDRASLSSFDSKQYSTPESRSITSSPENTQNDFICELSPAASSSELRSSSCSPEIKIMACSSLTQCSKSPQTERKAPQNDILSENEVPSQTHDLEGIIPAECFMSTTPTPTIYTLSSTQGSISSPSVCQEPLPRDRMSSDLKGTRYTESLSSDILQTCDPTNMATNNFSSMDRCVISPHLTVSIQRGTESPDVHEIGSVESSISTILPTNETTNMVISSVSNLSSGEGGTSRSPVTLITPRDTVSPDVVGTRSTESCISSTFPTKDSENVFSSPILQPSEGNISRLPSNLSTHRDTASPHVDGLICMKNPISATIFTNENNILPISPHSHHSPTNLSVPRITESPDIAGTRYAQSSMSAMLPIKEVEHVVITPSTDGGISRSPSTLSISRDSMSPDVAGYVESNISTIYATNEFTNMAISPISNLSSTDGGISRPSSTSHISINTASPDIDGVRCVEIPTSAIVLKNEMTDMAINLSVTKGISRPPSNLSIPSDTMFLDVEGTKYMKRSDEISTNETTNMAISNFSQTERGISRPPSTSSISRNTTSINELQSVESPKSTILPENEAPNMGMLPVFNISPTEGGLSNPPSTLGIPRGTISLDVQETRNTETSVEIPTNEITNMANSLISNFLSTEEGISRLQSALSIPRVTMSPDVDAVRCIESSASTILPENIGISPVYNVSSTEEGISRLPSALSIPRVTMSPDVPTILPENTDISPVYNLSSTEEGTDRQSSNLSIPRDIILPDVGGIKYAERTNEISTHENKNVALSISNRTTPSNVLTDTVSSPKLRYQRQSDRFADHMPASEMCTPLGYTAYHLSPTVSENMNLPVVPMVPADGQIGDTGYRMSLKSCRILQDDRTNIASVSCSQTDKICDSLPEPSAPKLSVKQIKESWERRNESILNSLNPWQTSKKILTVPTAKEGKASGREMLKRESAGTEKPFGQMAMRPGESPSVLHSNNHSMYEGQSCRNKGWSGERVIQEEHTFRKGVGNIAEGSYRGEQVELSFSTRNRKGPANKSPAPSSRDPKSGIPPRYFESPLATRRQQSLLTAQNLEKESKTGTRRIQPISQANHSRSGGLSSECTSETYSMASEFDDSDSEVKWFTDQAFRGLSSPQVDYLDVYNSSHGSSTNVSRPSTMDSPGSATWISSTDLHDSLHENDDVILCHTSSFVTPGTLDPAKCFEMGSFECVDVAVESKEETRRRKRTVPKRQIQFKRRNSDELNSTESEGKAADSLSTQTCSRDMFVLQHRTSVSMQEDLVQGEDEIQTSKKMLQKSLDESSPKSKMASRVIKSVLSKKMDAATKESSRSDPSENTKKCTETLSAGESSNAERQSSSLPSECSLSSEDIEWKVERSPHLQKRSCRPKVPPKPVFKPNFLPLNNNPAGDGFHGKTLLKDQIRPIMDNAFESEISKKQTFGNSEKEASKGGEKYSNDSGSTINPTSNCTAICVASTRSRMTNSDNKQLMTPDTHKQLEGGSSSSMYLSKTPEITLKPCTIKDKNKSSLKAPLCPELEISKDAISEPQIEKTIEERMRFKTGVEADSEEDNETNKPKSVIHKVRDVRKLVKNTYNLSFKASNTTHHVEDVVPEKLKEMQPESPHPLYIECKAISWKDKTTSCNESTTQQDVRHSIDESKMPQMDSQIRRDVGITNITAKTSLPNVQHSDVDLFVALDKCNSIAKSGNCEQSTKLEMPSRPPSKETSTLVFLQDSTPKPMQKPTCPASPNVKTANSSHSVSMLRKEKGMQADIGVCDVLNEGAGAKPKHINRLEVPLQIYASEGSSSESQKVKIEEADLLPEQKTSLNHGLQTSEGTLQVRSSPKPKEVRVLPSGKTGDNQRQEDLLQAPKEQEVTVSASSKAEVRAFSSSTKFHAMPITTSKEIELPIQVRSISSDRPKPSVLSKPSYKQPFAEIRSTSTDVPKTDITPTTSILKEQTHLKSDMKIIETSAAVIHNEQSSSTASSSAKTLAVSAVSSHRSQTIPVTTMSSSAQKSTATTGRQEVSITSVQNSSNQQNVQEQVIPATSYLSNYQTLPVVSQANTYIQPTITTSSNNQLHTNDFRFPTSDDPPSYDERESFSPLQLSDLPPRRQNRYHPTTKHSLCSCTSCTHPQFGQPFRGLQNQTPPAPRSPGQVISYPGAPPQAQVRPHQSRPDVQPSNYPSVSPKTTVQQALTMIQPMHHSHNCPAPAIQPYGNEQQQTSTQHMDRRSGNQRSPQVPSGATYQEHSRSPNIAALDPRSQFFNPQELPAAFGHEYGSDGPGGGGVLYPENASGLGYGQGPRRVLLDPETGKYFYIEVPMQPLRKMLFDPEIGQYVEVVIPQQAMSNTSVYPPTAAPYQGPYHTHGQGLYASQYLPYTMPPHSQSAQQPRHPEPSVPTSLHQNTMGYGSSASQAPKSDVKGHPSLDQSYLESMYYIPTGMNASPNSTPSECYHKPATNMPAVGGRRA